MGLKNHFIKRRRYYRNSPAILDQFAAECGLELCHFTGDCDLCENCRPEARTWVRMSYGEVTEAMEYVCANCLPAYRATHAEEMNAYSDRGWLRYWDRRALQYEIEKKQVREHYARYWANPNNHAYSMQYGATVVTP